MDKYLNGLLWRVSDVGNGKIIVETYTGYKIVEGLEYSVATKITSEHNEAILSLLEPIGTKNK